MLNLDMLSSCKWRPVLKAQAYSCRFAPLPVMELSKSVSSSDGEGGCHGKLSSEACQRWVLVMDPHLAAVRLPWRGRAWGSQQQIGRRQEWLLCGIVPSLPFLPVCICEVRCQVSSNPRFLCRGLCFFTFLPLPSLLECWWCEGPPDALRTSLLHTVCSVFPTFLYDEIWLLWKCSDLSEQQGLFLPSSCRERDPGERNQSQKGHGDRRRKSEWAVG